ncbi:STAS domain-containing protein [Actinokineospora enzanensis]|uniref:STAS domain-containing protein n=1 Tax=Actinokineospora enzanensis TaxID=155975 RepID=UPI00035CFC85|nr:STAS domain-containing protein [Actinokineospora enzanensis]
MRPNRPEMSVSHDRLAPVLRLRGDIDLATYPTVEAALAVRLSRAPRVLVVDLSEVGFIGSSGLLLLARTREDTDGRIMVAGCVPGVLRAMEVTGLLGTISPYRTVGDALASVAEC